MVRKQVVWIHQKASFLWPEAFSHQQFWVSEMEMVSVSGGIPKTSKTQNISGHRSEKILGAAWLIGPFAGPQIHLSTAWCQTQGLDGCWMMLEVERKETQTVRLVWKCETEVDLPKLPFQGSWVRTWASNAVASWIYAAPAHPQGTYPYKSDPWDGKNLCHTVMPTMFMHLGRKKNTWAPHFRTSSTIFRFFLELLRTETPAKRSGLRSRALWSARAIMIRSPFNGGMSSLVKIAGNHFFSNIDMLQLFEQKYVPAVFRQKKLYTFPFFCHSQNRGFHKWGASPIAGWFRMETPNKKVDDLGVPPWLRKPPNGYGSKPYPNSIQSHCWDFAGCFCVSSRNIIWISYESIILNMDS